MARPKIQAGAKTVPLVTHIPLPLKKQIITAAGKKDIGISEFVRRCITRGLADANRTR